MGYKNFMEPVPPRGSFQSAVRKAQLFYSMAEKGLSLCRAPPMDQKQDRASKQTTQP